MASAVKNKDGTYRIFVAKNGKKISKTFDSMKRGLEWGAATEAAIVAESNQPPDKTKQYEEKTFGELLEKYMKDVSPKKKTGKREIQRIQNIILLSSFRDIRFASNLALS